MVQPVLATLLRTHQSGADGPPLEPPLSTDGAVQSGAASEEIPSPESPRHVAAQPIPTDAGALPACVAGAQAVRRSTSLT